MQESSCECFQSLKFLIMHVFHYITLILISKYRDIAKIVCRKNFQITFIEMPYMLKFYTCSILSVCVHLLFGTVLFGTI